MRGDQVSRAQLLEWINMCSFAVDDTLLYLDTHPDDMEALEYFNKHCKLRKEALDEYAKNFGPLLIDNADTCSQSWEWIDDPWPWENVKGGC